MNDQDARERKNRKYRKMWERTTSALETDYARWKAEDARKLASLAPEQREEEEARRELDFETWLNGYKARQRAEKAEREVLQARAAAQQRDREIQKDLRDTPFEKTPLAQLATGKPSDLARVLGRSEQHITTTAHDMGMTKKGRWVFDTGQLKRLYDRLAPQTQGVSFTRKRRKSNHTRKRRKSNHL